MADLPCGIKVVDMPMLESDFTRAIQQFKASLPEYYRRDSWVDELKNQCAVLTIRHKGKPLSLLYLQVDFLARVYRAAHGGLAGQSSWDKMKANLLITKNGSADHIVDGQALFEQAMLEESGEDLITYIVKGGSLSLDTFTIKTPVALTALAEPYHGDTKPDQPDRWPSGLMLVTWMEHVLKTVCQSTFESWEWPYEEESILSFLVGFVHDVYKHTHHCDTFDANPWWRVRLCLTRGTVNSVGDRTVDVQDLIWDAFEATTASDFIKRLSDGFSDDSPEFLTIQPDGNNLLTKKHLYRK